MANRISDIPLLGWDPPPECVQAPAPKPYEWKEPLPPARLVVERARRTVHLDNTAQITPKSE
ncbi:hypothetical protein LCGC14_0298270 [marine sediment metagenome]|uniref:Uncharacterized protein n=1 Tax=marine sediment metagenome TaxID=412755 RepID=A0A0F9U8A3_9ZZZZ